MPVGPATGAGCAIDVPRPDGPFSQACDNVAIVQHRTLPSVGEGGGGRFAYSYFIRLMAEIKWLLVNI